MKCLTWRILANNFTERHSHKNLSKRAQRNDKMTWRLIMKLLTHNEILIKQRVAKLLSKQLITIVYVLAKGRSVEFHLEGYQCFCFRKRRNIWLFLPRSASKVAPNILNLWTIFILYDVRPVLGVLWNCICQRISKIRALISTCLNLLANLWHRMLYLRTKHKWSFLNVHSTPQP